MNFLKIFAISTAVALTLAACTTTTAPQAPTPRPAALPAPAPGPKPPGVVPSIISQSEAEQLCTLKAAKKFGGGLGDIKVTNAAKVDAGYRIKLSVGGQERNCIISPQGDLRSLV